MMEGPRDLTAEFLRFTRARRGGSPSSWEVQLAEACGHRRWPDRLLTPAGVDRFRLLELLVWAIGLEPDSAPRRVIVVDEQVPRPDVGLRRVGEFARALSRARGGPLAELASRLRDAAVRARLPPPPRAEPLQVVRLEHAGLEDAAWCRSPLQPAIVLIDSMRLLEGLLFRRWASAPGQWSMHAGLLGSDSIVILDESPGARALLPALRRIQAMDGAGEAISGRGMTMRVIEVESSPEQEATGATESEPPRTRRHESRLVRVVETKGRPGKVEPEDEGLDAIAAEVERAIARGDQRVGVFVPDPGLVVMVARRLSDRIESSPRVLAMEESVRPIDRAEQDDLALRLLDDGVEQVVLVGTDAMSGTPTPLFDFVVGMPASLETIDRRLRMLVPSAGADGVVGAIVAPPGAGDVTDGRTESVDADCSEHGELRWLIEQSACIDRPPARGRGRGAPEQDRCVPLELIRREAARRIRQRSSGSGKASGATLLPAHVATLSQTSPPPSIEPDIAKFVKLAPPEPSVLVCWRSDLPSDRIRSGALERYVQLLPPCGSEGVETSRRTAIEWLTRALEPPADEIVQGAGGKIRAIGIDPRRRRVTPVQRDADLVPGMILMLADRPAGGPDDRGVLATASRVPTVGDRADECWWQECGEPRLRLHPSVVERLEQRGDVECPPRLRAWIESPSEEGWAAAHPLLAGWLRRIVAAVRDRPSEAVLGALLPAIEAALHADAGRMRWERHPDAGVIVLGPTTSTRRVLLAKDFEIGGASLAAHSDRVAGVVADWCRSLELSSAVSEPLVVAARWHDVGKGDSRYQAALGGGLAWSRRLASSPGPHAVDLGAMMTAGWSPLACPESLSTAILQSVDLPLDARQRLLAEHLVASLHGRGRPFLPPLGMDFEEVELDFEDHGGSIASERLREPGARAADRFGGVQARLGPWSLAMLEVILRLADARVAEQERRELAESLQEARS